MKFITHVQNRLTTLGISCSLDDDNIVVERDKHLRPLRIRIEPEWEASYETYIKARSIGFEIDSRVLTHNNSIEVLVTRLSTPMLFNTDRYSLSDSIGNTISIGTCSNLFAIAFFDSDEYEKFFELRMKKRLLESSLSSRKVSDLLWTPNTATYNHKGRKTPPLLKEKALHAIRSSLFKIAVEQNDCLAVWKQRNRRLKSVHIEAPGDDQSIPRARYDEDVVSFYKVAKSSPFPSQSYLAYYHVLEYYFLLVAETKLHDRLASLLNNTSLTADKSTLDRLISLVRGQDSRNDETEMLRNVLDRYVPEQDLISFIEEIESKSGEKIYSKRRRVFGEDVQITPMKDLALANAAKTLKHIRNAIVHSSDRYKREDRHVPLSETEEIIEEFIPLVRFFAERVIFGSAA